MEKFDFLHTFYSQKHTRASLPQKIDKLLSVESLDARAIPFAISFIPEEFFLKISRADRKIELLQSFNGVSLFSLTHRFKQNGKSVRQTGKFFIYGFPKLKNVYVAITLENSRFWNKSLKPLLDKQYPNIVLTFITHEIWRRLLDRFAIKNGFSELRILQASYRVRMLSDKQGEKTMPVMSWPKMPLDEAFDWVYQQDGWFKSMQFEALRDQISYARIFLTRRGMVKTNRLFQKVFNGFLAPVCEIIGDNQKRFSNRSRSDNKELHSNPIVIDFGENHFNDENGNRNFIQAMEQLPRASVSVLHGNPFIHLSVLDYYDGSAFDVWVVDDKQVFIVPQMKGTVAAIKRLISHIFDTFAEGKIKDYEEAVT